MTAGGADAIVIGAGAAGLACAAELRRAGQRVLCLEARERIGGRIHTVWDAAAPIELGAEFVHGRPREIFAVAEAAGLAVDEGTGRMLHVFGGEVFEGDEGGGALEELARRGAPVPDRSLQTYLAESAWGAEEKQAAAGFAEGFNAARQEELSVAALAQELRAAEAIEGDRGFRLRAGYQALARALAGGLGEHVRLGSVVSAVEWRPGACCVQLAAGERFRAPRVVVTLPLGVLQAGAVRFDPEPAEILQAVRALRVGQAVRVTLRFERPFWEDAARFRETGFLISDEPEFPVWWSRLPWRDAVWTGWSAGPKADALLGLGERELVARAVAALERMLGMKAACVAGAWFHDWQADPFARGAYSWVPAGGLPAREALARPVADTLYFAGEATDLLGYGGTVHGAIASGRRAARQILAVPSPLPPLAPFR